MFQGLRQDIAAVRQRDPAARNNLEILLLYSGLHALMFYRVAHWLYQHKIIFIARFISQFARFITGIEIHPGAQVGRGVFIDHGAGVVIGETAVVGDGCTIYQGVTLGGTGKDKGKRHPTLGKNVLVGAGAKILGPFTVGDNCKVAAGAVLLTPLKSGCTAVGVPARVINCACLSLDTLELDHIHVHDPIAQELAHLSARIMYLENCLKKRGNDE